MSPTVLIGQPAASPPARGRGSKHGGAGRRIRTRASPPARGRGSKRASKHGIPEGGQSPPARGRGSKHYRLHDHRLEPSRPPRGGVDRNACQTYGPIVCPASPPARGRGSKQQKPNRDSEKDCVAPRAGAWIETRLSSALHSLGIFSDDASSSSPRRARLCARAWVSGSRRNGDAGQDEHLNGAKQRSLICVDMGDSHAP